MLERLTRLLGMSAPAAGPPAEFDPAFGLPWRAVSEWLARNPPIKAQYEAKFLPGEANREGGRPAATDGASGKSPRPGPANRPRPAGPAARADRELRRAVLEELRREPGVDAARVGVSVEGGTVTLGGRVASYEEKYAAERAARRVPGVKALVNEIEIEPPGDNRHTDQDIAADAVRALREDVLVPDDRIKVTVRDGWITLEGEVEWQSQRGAAERAVRYLTGAAGVTNRITVKPRLSPTVKPVNNPGK